ncbi:hypothetical protein O3M35_006451 [Rhynocoris fuscipes]|uniref:Peptidase S1 domain-containing protein n=1 Tax=Rhynocoris fuscipes TaxID=488301 RepID=A0AAW1DG39_9HEMI
MDECCYHPSVREEPITPKPKGRTGCGKRNVDGVGFRITGNVDNEAQFGEFPWMIAIVMEDILADGTVLNMYQCGGSLIHEKVVLTAAHCVIGKNPSTLKARAGEWDTQTTNELYPHQDRKVVKIITHDKYYSGALYNDIALIVLESPFTFADNVDIVCLPLQGSETLNNECYASGWGKNEFDKIDRPKVDGMLQPGYDGDLNVRSYSFRHDKPNRGYSYSNSNKDEPKPFQQIDFGKISMQESPDHFRIVRQSSNFFRGIQPSPDFSQGIIQTQRPYVQQSQPPPNYYHEPVLPSYYQEPKLTMNNYERQPHQSSVNTNNGNQQNVSETLNMEELPSNDEEIPESGINGELDVRFHRRTRRPNLLASTRTGRFIEGLLNNRDEKPRNVIQNIIQGIQQVRDQNQQHNQFNQPNTFIDPSYGRNYPNEFQQQPNIEPRQDEKRRNILGLVSDGISAVIEKKKEIIQKKAEAFNKLFNITKPPQSTVKPMPIKQIDQTTLAPNKQKDTLAPVIIVATASPTTVPAKEGKYQSILKKIDLPMVPRDKCVAELRKTRLGPYFRLHSSFVCAGGIPGKDTCKGDGGSPLVCPIPGRSYQYQQVGIVAWGIGCGNETPAVYVNVAMFRDWIDEQIKNLNLKFEYTY